MRIPLDQEADGGGKRRYGTGVELEDIPLCNVCSVEMSGERPGQVLEKGVENVSRFDGGLSRERLERLSEMSNEKLEQGKHEDERSRPSLLHRDSLGQLKNCCSRNSQQQRPSANTCNLHAMLHSAMNTRISGDGIVDDRRAEDLSNGSYTQPFPSKERLDIYVSVFDPIGEPAFEPSKTKPLPKWMHLLPNHIHREKVQKAKDIEGQGSHATRNVESQAFNTDPVSSSQLENQSQDSPRVFSSSISTAPKRQINPSTPPMDVPNARARAGSKVGFDPTPEIETIDGGNRRVARRSYTVESAYMTPPEYPRPKTPYPGLARPSLTHCEPISYLSHHPSESSIEVPANVEDSCCGLGALLRESTKTTEETSPRQLPSPPVFDHPFPLPSQSSEYLERYRPKIANTHYTKYIAKEPEPILNKLKRQRVGNQNLDQITEERSMKRHGGEREKNLRLESEEYGLDLRRKDLNQELRNLFCEE
ncbi:hypothetical protein EG329_004414 [Mollisiaceae sp. DMI_Dod_QoI]|nr:hypothetical protein EG329_004414 [Helotiales sp. DMI_Dod_QoI]